MDFWNYTAVRDACKRSGMTETADEFYRAAFTDAVKMGSGQFYGQLYIEREWERARRPYYNVWPSIVPMLRGKVGWNVGRHIEVAGLAASLWDAVG